MRAHRLESIAAQDSKSPGDALVVNELASGRPTPPTVLERLVAGCRYAAARQYRIESLGWYSPPLAALLAVAAMTIFVFCA